jgi:hypothetical protein
MAVVLTDGEVRPGDPILVELPPEPHRPLEVVLVRVASPALRELGGVISSTIDPAGDGTGVLSEK